MASSAGEQFGLLDFSDGHLPPEELNRQLRLHKAAALKLEDPENKTSMREEMAALKEENAALMEENVAQKKEIGVLKVQLRAFLDLASALALAHAPASASASALDSDPTFRDVMGFEEEQKEIQRQLLNQKQEHEHERRETEAEAEALRLRKLQEKEEKKSRRETEVAEAAADAERLIILQEEEETKRKAESARVNAEAERARVEADVARARVAAAADPLYKYRRSYTEAQIAANRAKVAPKGAGRAMYAAAEKGDAAELLKLVEPWFAHPVLNDYSGGHGGDVTPLITASRDGHIECVRVLVAQPGIELNKGHREHQTTALLWASWQGHIDIVELLCSLPGIDCNKADRYGHTPHRKACDKYFGTDKEERKTEIRAILKAKAEAEAEAEAKLLAADPLYKYRRSYTEAQIAANRAKVAPKGTGEAMYAAAQKGDWAELLKLVEPWFAHPVLNDYSGYGGAWTPLIGASINGNIECVRALVAQPGIELNKGNRYDQATPLLISSSYGQVNIVELLCSLPGIDCNKADTSGENPHSHACYLYSGSDKEERTRRIRAILEAKEQERQRLQQVDAEKRREA